MTTIEWTDETWNPTTGCDRVSPGCDNCYALTMAARLKAMGQAKYQRDGDPRTSGPGFGLTEHADALELPLRWRRPRKVFVNSMSDLFHPGVSDAFIAKVYAVMVAASDAHTFQVLTKRPQRMAQLLGSEDFQRAVQREVWALDTHMFAGFTRANHWWGTSIESDRYTFRADHLRATPAAVRFLSLEPLLGPLPSLDLTGIDWVIVGGESGRGARPMHPDWVTDIRDRCGEAGVPFFFKQWGAWRPGNAITRSSAFVSNHGFFCADGKWISRSEDHESRVHIARVGKKIAGRELDGRTWDEYPTIEGCDA